MNPALLITAFLLGIGGSIHCLGMCGPLAMALPFAPNDTTKKTMTLATYYLAKALAYGSMGILTGLLGKGFLLLNWQQNLSILSGLFILLLFFFPRLLKGKHPFLFQKKFGILYNRLQQQPKTKYYFFLGYLNGFLPCGLVYTALAASTVTGSPIQGFLFLFTFGIGTAPALIAILWFKHKMSLGFRAQLRRFSTVMTLGLGLILILRGLDLNIPYLSPGSNTQGKIQNCCHK